MQLMICELLKLKLVSLLKNSFIQIIKVYNYMRTYHMHGCSTCAAGQVNRKK